MNFPSNYFNKFFIAGILILLTGLLINYALPPLVSIYIDTQLALSQSSQAYPLWREVPVPVYQKFYFYNVTNAQDIEQRGHKPQLEEIGPFTYRSEWTKRDIDPNDAMYTISYKHYKQWFFEPDMSIADHQLQLVTLNAPLAITLSLIQSSSPAVRLLVTFSLDGLSDGFFTKRSVKQLLFDGYPDLLTTFGPLLNAEMLSQGGHFGYMNAKNNSDDGAYEVNTGVDDISKLNTINRYNGRTKLPFWNQNTGRCSSLEGATPGDMFPPMDDNQTSIRMFQPDFCRVWRLDYDQDLEPASGLRLKRFKATRDIFRNSTDLPENSCYFTHKRNNAAKEFQAQTNRIPESNNDARLPNSSPQRPGRQRQQQHQLAGAQANNNVNSNRHNKIRHEWPAGVFTLAPCKFNAPIYISMPHFLDADPYFISHVDGLNPDPERHEFYVDLEPRTGSPVSVSVRAQLNVAISKPPGLVRFRNVPEIMFPVFWQEFSVNVTGAPIEQIHLASRGAMEMIQRIACCFLVFGSVLTIISSMYQWASSFKSPEEEQ